MKESKLEKKLRRKTLEVYENTSFALAKPDFLPTSFGQYLEFHTPFLTCNIYSLPLFELWSLSEEKEGTGEFPLPEAG